MYQEDSFFSLSTAGSVGLAILSSVLALGLLWCAWRLMRGRDVVVRLLIAAGLFVGFVWLSPQIYYTYYGFLFDGLPVQWVGRLPSVAELFDTVRFGGRATLSAHSKAVLFWALVILALGRHGLRR